MTLAAAPATAVPATPAAAAAPAPARGAAPRAAAAAKCLGAPLPFVPHPASIPFCKGAPAQLGKRAKGGEGRARVCALSMNEKFYNVHIH